MTRPELVSVRVTRPSGGGDRAAVSRHGRRRAQSACRRCGRTLSDRLREAQGCERRADTSHDHPSPSDRRLLASSAHTAPDDDHATAYYTAPYAGANDASANHSRPTGADDAATDHAPPYANPINRLRCS